MANPERAFDAVVIGEPQRAFFGNQFGNTWPLFEHHGVALWLPEMGGAFNPRSEAHDLMMNVFGGLSKAERQRVRTRVAAAMEAATVEQGRFLGGRHHMATASSRTGVTPIRTRPRRDYASTPWHSTRSQPQW